MSIPGSASPLFIGAAAAAEAGYQIDRSLRFNDDDSAYLNRTPSSAGNRKTWTWSGWVKRSKLESKTRFFGNLDSTGWNGVHFEFSASDKIRLIDAGANPTINSQLITTASFRDPSAWYHIVVVLDTTESTASDRLKLYVNGVQITDFSTSNYPASNADGTLNTAQVHSLGRSGAYNVEYFNGYFADVYFIDGQALAPTDFGEYDDNNVWQPKEYSGTYGTNGFHLDFSDNTSTTAVAEDSSGNNNDWTANNISVASGAGNDSLIDTPTNYTAASGNNGGNYATLNPLMVDSQGTLSNGNLELTGGSGAFHGFSTIGVSSGKWYAEVTGLTGGGSSNYLAGIADLTQLNGSSVFDGFSRGYGYRNDALKINNNSASSYGATYTTSDVIGVAADLDNGTITFYKNGASQGTAYTGIPSGYTYHFAHFCRTSSDKVAWNFGQRPFAYTPPTGHLSLCTQNLPDPTIADGSTAFDVNTWVGDGTSNRLISTNFSPDFTWMKIISQNGQWHLLADVVRGGDKTLSTNNTNAEVTRTGFVSFDSDGFTIGDGNSNPSTAPTLVGFAWDAGTSTVSNTDGSITSSVRASQTNGCSIVTYQSPNSSSNQSVGHGLNAQPGLVIWKNRDTSYSWDVWHQSLSGTQTLQLDNTAATRTVAIPARPGSSVFETKTSYTHNGTDDYLALCFAPIEGFSAFGSYTGNGSNDGPGVFTGFRPAWLLIKNTTDGTDNDYWVLFDTTRSEYNPADKTLIPNLTNGEGTTSHVLDFLSNGFKLRATHTSRNASGDTYIYAAFAEHPFKTARAR